MDTRSKECYRGDLISRDVAIDALNEYFARIGKLKRIGLTKGEKAISLDTVGAIKTLPSAQRWIPCSERLPEYGAECLVTFSDDVLQIVGLSRCFAQKEGFWTEQPFGYEVIAWMPLPEPYTEEE